MRVPLNSRKDFDAELQRVGLGKWAPELARHAKWGVRLTSVKVSSDGEIPVGATKLGGSPDLPAGFDWPHREAYDLPGYITGAPPEPGGLLGVARKVGQSIGVVRDPVAERHTFESSNLAQPQPLTFIAQYDLTEIAALGSLDVDLPKSGLLSFFYDTQSQPWGFDPSDKKCLRVIWFDVHPDDLVRTTVPDELLNAKQTENRTSFPPARLETARILSPLTIDCYQMDQVGLPDESLDIYGEEVFWGTPPSIGFEDDGDSHQIGGWPDQVQNDMQFECQLVSNGLFCGDGDPYGTEDGLRLAPGAADWCLLLQVISDENSDMMWCDGGNLFVWIRKQDLAARNFDKAWLVLQTS